MAGNAALDANIALQALRDLAAGPAPLAAARTLSNQHERDVKLILTRLTHARGTRTPSAPGEPPALVSGTLRRSVTHIAVGSGPGLAIGAVWADAWYAGIQETGGRVTAKRFPQLGNPAVGFFGTSVDLPARPYMALALAEALANRESLGEMSASAFAAALGLS
jgi:phage gpG-like protein